MAILSFDIIPDTDSIELLHHYDQFYDLKGRVELSLARPIDLRQITVTFQGKIKSILSKDFTDKVAGHAASTEIVIRKSLSLLENENRRPWSGVSCWSFEINLDNENLCRLPPSLCTPDHQIEYQLSARLTLGSIAERVKLSYYLVQEAKGVKWIIRELQQRQLRLLHANRTIKMDKCIDHDRFGWVHYRGSRMNHISYEISLTGCVPKDQTQFEFFCSFYSHRSEAYVKRIEIILNQLERYPIQPGEVYSDRPLESSLMRTRIRKISQAEHAIDRTADSLDHLRFAVAMNNMAPDIQTTSLQITHILRLTVHFPDARKAKPMSLSFPFEVGTVPFSSVSAHAQADLSEHLPTYDQIAADQPPVVF
ncbi:hypothetical protein DFQ28_003828 [Apophysomyces sp. BC1034]|nr:hypothetical protein DFQ30_011360 [Apophysomyces sp. BC1015]KAG0178457.1 hypothetical protein DFQ29_003433 [Apophysomyces sp. BC1021]KAG0189129.1 hypothetical protein DFQ28_003828 [Apophysomyces sp. BC1034]